MFEIGDEVQIVGSELDGKLSVICDITIKPDGTREKNALCVLDNGVCRFESELKATGKNIDLIGEISYISTLGKASKKIPYYNKENYESAIREAFYFGMSIQVSDYTEENIYGKIVSEMLA